MPAVLEGAVPPPHLHLTSKHSWPPFNSPLKYPTPPTTSSPLPMSPESLHSYIPHINEHPLSGQELGGLPSSTWFGASVPAPDHNGTGYPPYSYDQPYITPHTSSITFSPPSQYPKTSEAPVSVVKDASIAAFSPASEYSRVSESAQPDYVRQPQESYTAQSKTTAETTTQAQVDSNPPTRPRSSPSAFTPNHPSNGPVEYPWPMVDPLGISTPNLHEQYYPGSTYPSPRRMYAPIAPHPIGSQRTSMPLKRGREEDEASDQSKRRKRSDSNTTMPVELGEEDRLLIQLKDEESMPWKDIAARFQSDLGKSYQIPALQMRLKRLRERMRVWTDTDVRALRAAHDYWVQSKFDIISQKMLEFGAAEKWTARQCARKWAEIDPGPTTSYTGFDHHSTPSYAPYTMSPVEGPGFMPYLHMS